MRVLPASLMSPRCWRWMAAALLICASGLLQAQDQAPPDDGSAGGDPPSRIARLSYREGDVGLLPSGEKDWGDASLNRPLTTGDRLSTGQSGRAELQLDTGTLRIADDSNFGFLTLNDQLTQVELTQGTVNLTVNNLGDGQGYEIDTPTVALVVNQPGNYRVDISEDGKSTRVTDFDGRATVYGEGGAQRMVASGRSYEFADSSLNEVTVNDIQGGDDFDAWCNSRNQRYAAQPADQYVSPDVVGAQDLNQYGNWQSDPDYGQVWYPSNVAADWSPYSDGHWSYVAPWGWTWVDTAPWGFAPYHYGRWAHVRERWCWVPGPIGVRPVYAPALVAFVGAGVSVSVGFGHGPVGWFPLGPGEVYNPWYRASRGYYTNVNVTNIYVRNVNRTVVINNINNNYNYFRSGRDMPNERYVNREVPHAFRAMSGQDFVAARNARQHMAPVDPRQFAQAPVMSRGVSSIAPVRTSYVPPRAANARPLPAAGFQREVVARTPPAANFGGRPANVAGAPRMAPVSGNNGNVRLLNGQGPGMRTNAPNRQPTFTQEQNGPARNITQAPAQVPGRPAPRPDNEAQMRPGELPSARFARPNVQQPPPNQQRPGVSYIPNAAEDRARGTPPQGTLPNVPRFEQAQPQDMQQRQMQQQQMQQREQAQRQAQQQEMQQRQVQQQQTQQREEAQRQAQQQEMQQRQAQQQQMQQREEVQRQAQQQEMQQRQMQQQEMQQRQAQQQQMQEREMQQRQAAQQQEMQQREMQMQQQRSYQQPQAQPRPQPQPQHEDRKPPPPRKDEQHN